jgi:ribosomal protein S18 acetylase RimI-like enzyme
MKMRGYDPIVMWSIRDARTGDHRALNEVFRRSSLSNAGERELLLAHPEVLSLTDDELAAGLTRVAVLKRVIVGFTQLGVHGDRLELVGLFVEPDHMRRGIGRDLVLDAAAIARTRALDGIEVTANDHAMGFYVRLGFVDIGTEVTPLGVTAKRMRRAVPA